MTVSTTDFRREIVPDPYPDTSFLEQEGFEDRLEEFQRGGFEFRRGSCRPSICEFHTAWDTSAIGSKAPACGESRATAGKTTSIRSFRKRRAFSPTCWRNWASRSRDESTDERRG